MNTRKPCFGVCLATVTKFGSQQKKPVSFVPPSGLNAASSDIMISSFGMCTDGGPLTDTLRNLFITCSLSLPTHPKLGLAATRWDSVKISLSHKLLEQKH